MFSKRFKPRTRFLKEPTLFYLKSQEPTPESSELARYLLKSVPEVVVDDPEETASRSLEWYVDNLYNSVGVIAHFLSDKSRDKNAKYALVSGMAYGLAIDLLMLAHAPHKPAIDYRDLMFVHKTAKKCVEHVEIWLELEVRKNLARFRQRYTEHRRRLNAAAVLEKIDLGAYEAELEKERLNKYFVQTGIYKQALRTAGYTIYVGRKGSGKTANFYRIAQEIREATESRNHVCVIQPMRVELVVSPIRY